MTDLDEEDVIEVEPCLDLSDMRYVGGVRLILPRGICDVGRDRPVVDLPAVRAAKLAEAIIAVLYQTGKLKPTI